MFWNAIAIVYGAFVALFPERVLDYLARALLAGYRNPEALEPEEWYVSLVRIKGVLIVLAGVLAIFLELWSTRSKSKSSSSSASAEAEA